MKNIENVKCVHIIKCTKVCAVFAENKVHFARVEKLCFRHSARIRSNSRTEGRLNTTSS